MGVLLYSLCIGVSECCNETLERSTNRIDFDRFRCLGASVMKGKLSSRYADAIVSRSKLVIILLLIFTVVVSAGAVIGESEDGGIGQFDVDTEETAAFEDIQESYNTDDRIVTQIVIRDEGGDVLTQESLLKSLRLQQDVRENESINSTLADQGFVGLENVVATAAVREDRAATGDPPTLDEQVEALESRSDAEVEALLADVLHSDTGNSRFLPADYESGSADARITFAFHAGHGQATDSADEDPAAYDAQIAIESMFEDRFNDGFVFGQGITDAVSSSAVGDSFVIITPVALILVLFVLAVTYRDVIDVLISLFGIGVVMAWLAGIQGWLGIPSSQILIAVPFLLIGLSIDYSLHVVMRYREARTGSLDEVAEATGGRSPRTGMGLGLASTTSGV